MPRRVRATRSRCHSASRCAPSTGSIGCVPCGRVKWPIPCALASSQVAGSENASCSGATPPPSSASTHTLPSCASFSARVISASRASTRLLGGRAASDQGWLMLGSCPMRPGLCSVTLRRLSVPEVAAVAARAGLAAIEWGADVHVPPGDLTAADAARDAFPVAAYGSYFRAGEEQDFAPVVRTARRLGAPRIRIWAGRVGSAEATPEQRAAVVDGVRAAADAADGLEVALEFHGGTLTDTAESALALLDEAGRESVRTYWQPPQGVRDAAALAGLRLGKPRPAPLHVFSWWPRDERLPLSARADLWREALGLAGAVDALLEFVPGDEPDAVVRDAATLRELADG